MVLYFCLVGDYQEEAAKAALAVFKWLVENVGPAGVVAILLLLLQLYLQDRFHKQNVAILNDTIKEKKVR
jgi:hypothetical protein